LGSDLFGKESGGWGKKTLAHARGSEDAERSEPRL